MKEMLFQVLTMTAALAVFASEGATQSRTFVPVAHGPFYLQSYTGKCLTYGTWGPPKYPGDPPPSATAGLYLDNCSQSGVPRPNETLLQRILIREINANHDVVLEASGKVVGVVSNDLRPGVRLELQNYTGARGQIWAFDGDTLLLRASRNLVAEVQNGRTPRGTAIVLGLRDIDDSEFWRFVAVDGTYKKPTNGFVRVSQNKDLRTALQDASWGTVIEINEGAWIPLDPCAYPGACPEGQTDAFPLRIPPGVTLRGNRHGKAFGPVLTVSSYPPFPGQVPRIFDIGNHVRITGLRIHGPSLDKDDKPSLSGVFVRDGDSPRPIIDHNEMLGWTEAAVHVNSYDDNNPETDFQCGAIPTPRPSTVRVIRNFLHHNAQAGLGYGVTIHSNGFAAILGNTFLYNRHAIAADGLRGTGYSAHFNLVLSNSPDYGFNVEHDFDMHGTGEDGPGNDYSGGIAGSDVDIARNTFLGVDPSGPDTRYNYDVRGEPCGLHRFRSNVSVQGEWDAVDWYGKPFPGAPPPAWLQISNNKFASPNPTQRLGKGDFDGDGNQDLLLATGAAWYYSPGGVAEWRHRNDEKVGLDNLLFGDVDGDGRTDVLFKQQRNWFVSWAGASKREKINESAGPITDFAVGDFNGDGRADLLHATGAEWRVSYGGAAPFALLYPSPLRVSRLRFGDFDADGRTDVFAVIGNVWYMRRGGRGPWVTLRTALTSSVDNLVVADFNGDGWSDVALSDSSTWKVSYSARGNWTTLRSGEIDLQEAVAIGAFDGVPGADVLAWGGLLFLGDWRNLHIFSGGWADPLRHSRWDMR